MVSKPQVNISESYYHSGNHENPKHQKPNIKQIPMTQIQSSKHIRQHSCQMAKPPTYKGLCSDTAQLR
jgi:hypothetical protein